MELGTKLFEHEDEDDAATTTTTAATPPPENTDDEEAYAPSSKKSKRGSAHKKVVTVPIVIGEVSRSKGEVYPPPDSWSWRKYGQKPIKGSPFPRGYYRCSSSKGCPARKQVERSRLDPTTLLITYACDHNHPIPTTRNNHHHHQTAAAKSSSPSSATVAANNPPANFPPEECAAFANQPDIELEPADNGFAELAGEFGWLCHVGSTVMDGTILVGPTWAHADVEAHMPIGEEDKLMFGDLGDLPESSVVSRWYRVETPC